MNVVDKERKIVNKMFNDMYSFYVAESNIHETMPSTPDPQMQSTVLIPLHFYDKTDSHERNEPEDLRCPNRNGCFKTVYFGAVFYNKRKFKVEL